MLFHRLSRICVSNPNSLIFNFEIKKMSEARSTFKMLFCTKGSKMRAHYNGLIPRNPFAQFHISPNVKEREYLTEDGIKKIMAHKFDNHTLALARNLLILPVSPCCLSWI